MLPSDTPENIRKPKISDVFRGIKREHWEIRVTPRTKLI